MNTIKFATFAIPSNELIKQSKGVGISMLVTLGSQHKSFTLVGQRAMPEAIASLTRTTCQKPTGFTDVEAEKVACALGKEGFKAIPSPLEISKAITKAKLSLYI